MINSTLQYFKNIKFNPLVNKTVVNEGKKKYTINKIKNYQQINYQKMSTRHISFNTYTF